MVANKTVNVLSSIVPREETDLWTVSDRSGRFEARTEYRTSDNLKTNYFLWTRNNFNSELKSFDILIVLMS